MKILKLSLLALIAVFAGCQSPSHKAVKSATVEKLGPVAPATFSITDVGNKSSYAGYPVDRKNHGLKILENIGYSVGYSEDLLNPLWATYYCDGEKTYTAGERPSRFSKDERLSSLAQLTHTDYNNPRGLTDKSQTYDRGHMAPNSAIATRYGDDAQRETFLLTNICPQRSCLNQTTWEALEKRISTTYSKDMDGVWVTVGPIFGEDRGTHYEKEIAIPVAFYCIVLERKPNGSLSALAITMTQETKGIRKLADFVTTIDEIENETGLDFFAALPDTQESKLESSLAGAEWDLNSDLIPSRAAQDPCK